MWGVLRYNMSAESPAKSTLSQGHGLSTGRGEYIYIYMCGSRRLTLGLNQGLESQQSSAKGYRLGAYKL